MTTHFNIRHLGPSPRPLATPARSNFAAFGDIHGHLGLLLALEEHLDHWFSTAGFIERTPEYVYLGDYVDRGPFSMKVVDHLRKPHALGFKKKAILGNHETMLLEAVRNPDKLDTVHWWMSNGGIDTMAEVCEQISAKNAREVDLAWGEDRLDWLANLPRHYSIEKYLFVHAGIYPGIELSVQKEEVLLWIRGPFLDHDGSFMPEDWFVVHGHTPCREIEMSGANRFNCDTGAFATGMLSAYVVAGGQAYHAAVVDPALRRKRL